MPLETIMPGRPPLPLGTWGEIRTYFRLSPDSKWLAGETLDTTVAKPDSWRAMAQFRDYDGHTRQIERFGKSRTSATNRLRGALRERAGHTTTLTVQSRFRDASTVWLKRIETRRVGTTFDRYTSRLNNHVLPAIGELRLRECTTGRLEKFMDELEAQGLSAETRRGIRTVLSGVLQVAVREELLATNPAHGMTAIEGATKKVRAYDTDTLLDFLTKLDNDKRAVGADLPDLLRFLFGTGARFGEALALRWREVNLTDSPISLDGGTIPPHAVWLNGNIVHVSRKGLVRHDGKTENARRKIGLPGFLYTLLLVRTPVDADPWEPVFPSGTLGWRHPSNVQRSVRRMRDRIGFPDFTTHIGRKTVATALDDAGQSARQVADQLGQANIATTQKHYLGRGLANPAAAEAIDAVHRTTDH
jgi:integrase